MTCCDDFYNHPNPKPQPRPEPKIERKSLGCSKRTLFVVMGGRNIGGEPSYHPNSQPLKRRTLLIVVRK